MDFPSVVHAVQCAQQVQAQFRTHNAEKESAGQIHVRISIHEEEARAAGAEMLRLMPQFSVEKWKRMAPYKDPTVTERIAAALRKAGLK